MSPFRRRRFFLSRRSDSTPKVASGTHYGWSCIPLQGHRNIGSASRSPWSAVRQEESKAEKRVILQSAKTWERLRLISSNGRWVERIGGGSRPSCKCPSARALVLPSLSLVHEHDLTNEPSSAHTTDRCSCITETADIPGIPRVLSRSLSRRRQKWIQLTRHIPS